MLTTLETRNGVYSDMQYVNKQQDRVTYLARYTLRDGYSEMRYVTVCNGKVVAWYT